MNLNKSKTTLTGKCLILALALNLLLTNSVVGAGITESAKKVKSTKTLRSMARIYMAVGDYAKAQPFAERALAMARSKGRDDSELAMCLIDVGTLYGYQGNLDDAERIYLEGMEIQEKLLYKKHPHLAYMLKSLSSIYYKQGQYSKAMSTLNRAIDIMLDSHSADDKGLASFYVEIAKNLAGQKRLKQSESYYEKAMVIINTSYGPDHLYTASVLASMAELYTLQGRYNKAEGLIDHAISTSEKIYGEGHHLVSRHWVTKAGICRAKGDYVQAEMLVNKALIAIELSGNTKSFAKLVQEAQKILAGLGSHGQITKR